MVVIYAKTNGDTINQLTADETQFSNHMIGLLCIHGKIVVDPDFIQKQLYICSDFCEQSIVANYGALPILRTLYLPDPNKAGCCEINNEYENILWLEVVRSEASQLRLYLTYDNGQLATLRHCDLMCTLLTFEKSRGERKEESKRRRR